MSKEEIIKDFDGSFRGIVETETNGNKTVRAWPGRQVLGFYYKNRNVTTDFFGKVISQGDTAVSLIYNQPKR